MKVETERPILFGLGAGKIVHLCLQTKRANVRVSFAAGIESAYKTCIWR